MFSLSPQLGYGNPFPQMLFERSVSSLGKLALGPHEASGEAPGTSSRREQIYTGEHILID